ncbi:ankyrin repeat-containing domain protein, partial [Pilobolus umbonatus]
ITSKVTQRSHQATIVMGATPTITIWEAAKEGDIEVLTYFINSYNMELNLRDPITECTLLHLIVSHNENPTQALKLLLENGADPTGRNIYNVQPIHALFLRCSEPLECVKLLLDYETDPNARDGDGWTPLHYAARFCQLPEPVIKLLIDAGADINAVDTCQKTALFALLANGDHSSTLSWLITSAKAN